MKHNSYIIPAVQFYLLKMPQLAYSYPMDYLKSVLANQIERRNFTLIPFDNINGLTGEEIAKCFHLDKYFAIAPAVVADEYYISGAQKNTSFNISFLDGIIFNKDIDETMEIGQRMENYIFRNYNSFSDKQKRIYHSFLEQYQYDGYESAKAKIKSIEQNRK